MENLIVYFVILLLISSLLSRLQRRAQQQAKPSAQRPRMPERDLTGPAPSRSRISPQPSVEPASRRETFLEQLQEEWGIPQETTERPRQESPEYVEPESTGPEFRYRSEVRSGPESKPGREFRPGPEFGSPEKASEAKPQERRAASRPQASVRRAQPRRGALSFRFGPDVVRRGIILAEILGPPRAMQRDTRSY